MKKKIAIGLIVGIALLGMIAPFAYGDYEWDYPANETSTERPAPPEGIKLESKEDVEDLFWGLFDILWTVFWVLAVIFIFIAAYFYLTGGANPENIKKATSMLKYAVVAIIVALVAKSLPWLISDILRP